MNKMLAPLLVGALLACTGTSSPAMWFGAEGGTMLAHGEIEPGDYQKFVAAYRSWDAPPTIYSFSSPGGDVVEAIAIANFVRLTRIPVWVFGECYSACAFIFMAAPDRTGSGEIGLHRPYYDRSYFAGLSSLEAETEFRFLERITRVFLNDIGVEQSVVEIIRTVPSDQVRIFKGQAEVAAALGQQSAFLEEWQMSKCGSVEPDAALAWCATTWNDTVQLNLAYAKGWKERFLAAPQATYSDLMPALCHKNTDLILRTAKSALDNDGIMEALKVRGESVAERGKCIEAAESKEVWAFFNSMKKSPEAYAIFNKPARDMVMMKYGRAVKP